jgi:hypothetical protein
MEDSGSITAYIALALGVASTIFGIVNHKRIRSNCCGSKTEISIDVEDTTPPEKLKITVPKVDETPEHKSV